jgi:hypothetical protein
VCIATLSRAGLAFDVEIAEAFGVHRNTVARLARQLAEQGLAGVVAAKRGPKAPHKVTGQVQAVIDDGVAAGLGPAEVTRRIVSSTGVSLSREHVRQLMAHRRSQRCDQLTLVADATDGEVDTDDDTDVDTDVDSDDGDDSATATTTTTTTRARTRATRRTAAGAARSLATLLVSIRRRCCHEGWLARTSG